MGDITNPKLIYAKGFLFLLCGLLAALALLIEVPNLRGFFLLTVTVWCFCRFYYFAFYVIEHYVDPGYRFAGLGSFVLYLLKRPRTAPTGKLTPSIKLDEQHPEAGIQQVGAPVLPEE